MDPNAPHDFPVVLDTNVIRGAARASANYSSDLVQAVLTGRLRIALSTPMVMEYLDVLSRPDLGLPGEEVRNFVGALCGVAERKRVWFRLPVLSRGLSDPTARRRRERDEKVLELAFAAGAETIVTHNVRGMQRLAAGADPERALRFLRGRPSGTDAPGDLRNTASG